MHLKSKGSANITRPPPPGSLRPFRISTISSTSVEVGSGAVGSTTEQVLNNSGAAVVVKDAAKSYKSGVPVISGMNMVVPAGSIYALLGSSGCGKTTMLSCIVGTKKLESGDVWIFGKRPGSPGLGIPGKNIGYMPQEISLYMEFTIEEIMIYFGELCGMSKEKIHAELRFLTTLLELPKASSIIGKLSGGEQRRVSFATALIHKPQLLILDEPTVGVDPVLREKIWTHIVNLVASKQVTVIITTHHIDETSRSDTVAVMRTGKLLVEKPVADLLDEYNESSLENIVLKLCQKENDAAERKLPALSKPSGCVPIPVPQTRSRVVTSATISGQTSESRSCRESLSRITALTRKNFRILLRNPILLIFNCWSTAFVVACICISFGNDPAYLKVGLVNPEITNYTAVCPNVQPVEGECHLENLSCLFLNKISNVTMQLVPFKTVEDAMIAARSGQISGYIEFQANFSTDFYVRITTDAKSVDEGGLNKSDIVVRLDETSKQVSNKIKKSLYDAFDDFMDDLLGNCGMDRRLGKSPLRYKKPPVYGKDGTDDRPFVATAAAPSFMFFFAIIPSSIRFIKEKKNGIYTRTMVLGSSTWEFILGYTISEICILLVQSGLMYFIFTAFQLEILGSSLLTIAIIALAGFVGIQFGFLLGVICGEEIAAALITFTTFAPTLFLNGVWWPAECIYPIIQKVAAYLPCSQASNSIRSIVTRGWEFTHPVVWPGFAIAGSYVFIFFCLTILAHKLIKK